MIMILIKSFNRPYYLNRCLKSIYQNVKGDIEVIILDDGTPDIYLKKIQLEFSEVKIIKSRNYHEKVKLIEKNKKNKTEINGFKIPTQLWKEAVKNASDYVLIIEDDVWFVDEINVDKIVSEMKSQQVELVKLGWLGNRYDEKFIQIDSLTQNLDVTIPKKLFTSNKFIMDLFMYNKYKFFSILFKLGLVDNETKRKYYILNSILMGLYKKEYWLEIWKDADGKVDEKQQLRNAAIYYHKKRDNSNFVCRTKKEYLKTTFQSSATNSYHQYGFDFDVNYFNYLINEAWLSGSFDVFQNYPNDFTLDYFSQFIDEWIDKGAFYNWVDKFKSQYRNLGAEVD